jgi:hypothetical protein
MATRPLEDNWPSLVDSTGTPGTGTKLKKDTFDDIHDAIETSIYDPSLDEGPPEIASEVVAGRAAYANLNARFAAIEAAAAGGLAVDNLHVGGINVVPNDAFAIWSNETANQPPDYWSVDAGFTSLVAMTAQGGPAHGNATDFFARNYVALTNPDTTTRYFYVQLITAAQLTTYGSARLKSSKVGAGCFLYSSTPNAADVFVFDGVTNHKVGEQGSGVDQWIWSGAGVTYTGAATLVAAPGQLTLRIGVKQAATVYVASPALVFGFDSLARWPGPCPSKRSQWVWGAADDGQIGTGLKARWYPTNPSFVHSTRLLYDTGSGTNTYTFFKNDATVVSPSVTGGGTDSGVVSPANIKRASLGRGDLAKISCDAADATARGPSLSIDYFEYLPPLEAAFGANIAIPVS